jgi:hypothetical protein
MRGTREV